MSALGSSLGQVCEIADLLANKLAGYATSSDYAAGLSTALFFTRDRGIKDAIISFIDVLKTKAGL